MLALRLTLSSVAGLWVGGCSHTPKAVMPSEDLTPAAPQTVEIDPRAPWNPTGFYMERGGLYRLCAQAYPDEAGQPYRDKSIKCTPDGPTGFRGWLLNLMARDARCPLNPANWVGPGRVKRLRVLRDGNGRRASFLTVIGTIGYDDAGPNTFVIGQGADVTAPATGELVVFCNDWPGGPGQEGEDRFKDSKSYANNRGRIRLTITRLGGSAEPSRTP